ncbi:MULTISPECIES: hypothetical protein [unclassified Prochlorococcus]|nr:MULTISPECIES: hypothetical protein [unclassified Prochlorococcus]KGG25523.1 hypothetical protein EV12_2164 [Prochlorococcus sp. MIT 0701]KGG27329.1 hypothetical protein EV13_2186 [Prochlorococcus sp. MIT 0702]KGG31506.1 hypothetical protein EV14_2182 [Prochlorococcus sp. MIT 0703]
MTEIIASVADLGDGVLVGGINSNELKHNYSFLIMTTFTNQITQAEFEALVMSELEDMELTPEQLAFITGGGFWAWVKKTAKKAADWAESTFGDGDGKHEVSDYIDEVLTVVAALSSKSSGNED